jgi:hypothetical protein
MNNKKHNMIIIGKSFFKIIATTPITNIAKPPTTFKIIGKNIIRSKITKIVTIPTPTLIIIKNN